MRVLVTGGTGFVGRHLCNELHRSGHEVIAMSRDPDPTVVTNSVELRSGDVTEYEGLPETVADADVVVNLVALSPLYRPSGGEQMHEEVHVQGTRNLVRAMEAAGVDRLIHQSGIGAEPDASTAYLRAKGRTEGIVRNAEPAWTIFRPAILYGADAEFLSFVKRVTTPYVTGLPGGGRTPFQPMWIGDFAPLMRETIEDRGHAGESYTIGGPDVLTLADITRAVYRSEGRSVHIVPVPMLVVGLAFTVAGPLPLVPFGRDQYRSLRLDHTVGENDLAVFDRTTEDLLAIETYLREGAPEK